MPKYTLAVAAREKAFEPLRKVVTKSLDALRAFTNDKNIAEGANTIAKKIKGSRSKAKKSDEEIAALPEADKEVRTVSTSQMSYDNRLENFYNYIQFISSVPEYQPNETEIQIATLKALYDELKAKNEEVASALIPLNNARIARNEILYKADTSLSNVVNDTKAYVRSLYGATSPQYKQILKLKFRNKDL